MVPHAPCLLVKMLRIFCFSWFAVTWSLCLAALMRWSHIFSSSLLSAAYWAQLDYEKKEQRKWFSHHTLLMISIKLWTHDIVIHTGWLTSNSACLCTSSALCLLRMNSASLATRTMWSFMAWHRSLSIEKYVNYMNCLHYNSVNLKLLLLFLHNEILLSIYYTRSHKNRQRECEHRFWYEIIT